MPPVPDLPFPTRYQETVALESILPRGTALRYEQLPPMPPLSDDLIWLTAPYGGSQGIPGPNTANQTDWRLR